MQNSLCKTNEISAPGSKGIEISLNGEIIQLYVVHKDGQFHAYINRCPHTGVNLDWQGNQFLDMENVFIQCSTHDALFEISTGRCISGPCIGKNLTPVEITVRDNVIYASA